MELLASGHPIEKIFLSQSSGGGPIAQIRRKVADEGIPVRQVPRTELDRIAYGLNHQGVVAVAGDYTYSSFEELLTGPEPCLLFLDGVTDPHNLGSLLRTADGAGFDGVVIPSRRSAGVNATVRRVAAGAAEVVKVARVPSLGAALERARDAGVWLAGLDAEGTESVWEARSLDPPVGLVLGAEDRGLSKGVKARCESLVSIPLVGQISSLNVGVAGGIAMFEVARRRMESATL